MKVMQKVLMWLAKKTCLIRKVCIKGECRDYSPSKS